MSVRWTPELDEQLTSLRIKYNNYSNKWIMISKDMGISPELIRCHWKSKKNKSSVSEPLSGETSKVEYSDDSISVIQASPRIMSQEDLMKAYKIDPKKWRVEKYIVRTSEGYRKDRQVSWHVVDGQVVQGDVEDTGKMLVVPLYHMELRLVRKAKEINARNAIDSLLVDACKFAPKYPKIEYDLHDHGMLYEIAMPDIHFGRLTWHEETSNDYDIKIAKSVVRAAVSKLLQYTDSYGIDRILLPIGNDFFNVNSKSNTTVGGTPQDEDTRWQKTFRAGRMLVVEMIDACSAVAPVDVLLIPGNHDEEKLFYLGDALVSWYHNSDNVTINNDAKSRKYYDFGKVLLGFTHGDATTMKKLPNLMQFEAPQLWGNSLYREWHTGHWHHKADLLMEVDEQVGITMRILRSLVPEDAWTFSKGLVGSLRAAEAFLWHPDDGLVAQFTARIDTSKYVAV
jgi:hypothetical protein